MYKFRDTKISSEKSMVLPPEAMLINGEYVENLIPGYTTLYTRGRETLSPDLDMYNVGSRDGSYLKSKRFLKRIITVGYQLKAKNSQEFRESYNHLGKLLNEKESILIFDDEPDKFYKASFYEMSDVDPGKNCVIGEFKMICLDPFKYSVVQYEAVGSDDDNSILIDYKGTYKSHPILEADFHEGDSADCGYVAFFNDEEKVIQLGDPEELDGENVYEKSQTLINQSFDKSDSQHTGWTLNQGKTISDVTQTGDFHMGIASYRASQTQKETSSVLMSEVSNTADNPHIYYRVTAKSSERSETSVKLTFTITSWLENFGWVGYGYGLKVAIYIGGSWHEVVLKGLSDYWKGSGGHAVNIVYTVTGINKDTETISNIKFRATRLDSIGGVWGKISERGINSMPIAKFVEDVPEKYCLEPNYGTGSAWHGPSILKNIGADASGKVGAKHCTCTFTQLFDCTDPSQIGAFQALLISTDGNVVAGVRISKNSVGHLADLSFYAKNKCFYSTKVSVKAGESSVDVGVITKQGSHLSFNIAGVSNEINDDSLLDVTQVKFVFESYESKKKLNHNGLTYAKFIKNNCDEFKNIPNKFSANDVLTADCSNCEIKLNGIATPSLGALANAWEGFVLKPGLNQIGYAYSEWAQKKPTIKVKYREVYL